MKTIYEHIWIKTFPGFYGTWFEPFYDDDVTYDWIGPCGADEDKIKADELDIWRYFDNAAYQKDVCQDCSTFIGDELSNYFDGIHVRFESMDSPREYNFSNDHLYVNIEVDDDDKFRSQFYKWIEEHKEYVAKRLKADFTPRSGFIPFYDDDYDEFMSKMEFGDESWDILLSYIVEYQYHDNLEYTADLMMYEFCESKPESYVTLPEEYLIKE